MFTVQGIDHVVIRVRDLERAVAFYRDVLGLAVEKTLAHLGLVHLRAGAALIDLVAVDGELGRRGGVAPAPGSHNVDHVCLRVEPFDFAALRDALAAHGVGVDGPHDNYGAEGDGPALYLRDPEGNAIELKGVRKPST